MFKTLQTLTSAVATLILTGCANTYNPLEDFEQVEPAAALDSPSATGEASGPGQRATAPFIHFGIYLSRQ